MFCASLLPCQLSDRFALIIDGLCRAVAARAPGDAGAAPLLVLLWGRLRRMAARFAELANRAGGGSLAVRQTRGRRAARGVRTRQRWPAGFAWLVRLVPEAACYGAQLRQLLSEPEMAAFIAATPLAGRMFGPLGQMLAVPMRPTRARTMQTGATRLGAMQTGAGLRKPVRVRAAAAPAPVRVWVASDGPPAAGVPYWLRNANPRHDIAGQDPPRRRCPPEALEGGRRSPALERSG